jgi:hypothetical protein
MVKIADSAAISENIPTRPREGKVQGVSGAGTATGVALIVQPLILLLLRNM